MSHYIHPSAIVDTEEIGESTRIWAFVHILKNVRIGSNCNICDHCFIEGNVIIGNNVTIKSGIYLWDGIIIDDDVFLGPNVVFTNDIRPRSKNYKEPVKTLVKKGASIGANSTILAGTTFGEYAMSGIGSVITRDVPPYALVYGNPAKQNGWVDETGEKLIKIKENIWQSSNGKKYLEKDYLLFPLKANNKIYEI
jgi:acetyltransferase-like isoleucine patch superfamily enzyme